MGEAITGQWNRIYTAPFSGAEKWGTGINPIHQYYGEQDDPLRVYGRPVDKNPFETPQHSPGKIAPFEASPDFINTAEPWGYQPEDIAGLDVFQLSGYEENRHGMDVVNDTDHPNWDTPTDNRSDATRYRVPLDIPGRETSGRLRAGQEDADEHVSDQVPTETVSEGWVNKPASGFGIGESGDNVIVSDPAQYERQTSMQQRNAVQDNERAQMRMTDDPREPISSRFAPMKLKLYSGQQRHYDMFPYQIDDMPRPFWFRRAGTGRREELLPNEMYVIEPIQRTPPPDPSLGPPEESLNDPNYEDHFGYTNEDQGWY